MCCSCSCRSVVQSPTRTRVRDRVVTQKRTAGRRGRRARRRARACSCWPRWRRRRRRWGPRGAAPRWRRWPRAPRRCWRWQAPSPRSLVTPSRTLQGGLAAAGRMRARALWRLPPCASLDRPVLWLDTITEPAKQLLCSWSGPCGARRCGHTGLSRARWRAAGEERRESALLRCLSAWLRMDPWGSGGLLSPAELHSLQVSHRPPHGSTAAGALLCLARRTCPGTGRIRRPHVDAAACASKQLEPAQASPRP